MIARILASIFLGLHGFVHMLYLAQSQRIFELKPGMTWPAGSWALTKLLGDNATRAFTSAFCALAAAGLVISAIGLVSGQAWWRSATIASAALSGALFFLSWNGRMQNLDGQGAIGVLLDGLILPSVLIFRWP
jgi:hypothetical protein